MKKILLNLLLIGIILALPLLALAVGHDTSVKPPATINIADTITNITNFAFTILLVVAAMMLVFAAFQFITSQGDIEKVKSARDYVLYALIGVIVAFMSRGLVALVQTFISE